MQVRPNPRNVVTGIARAMRLSVTATERMVELVDLGASGLIDLDGVVVEIPTLPRRALLIVRDVVIVLAQMPAQDERPWHDFHDRFRHTHMSWRSSRSRRRQMHVAAAPRETLTSR